MCESWKRKENLLANKWLVRDYNQIAFERADYKATITIDSKTRSYWKRVYGAEIGKSFYLGMPVSVLFALCVIGIAIANRYLNNFFI